MLSGVEAYVATSIIVVDAKVMMSVDKCVDAENGVTLPPEIWELSTGVWGFVGLVIVALPAERYTLGGGPPTDVVMAGSVSLPGERNTLGYFECYLHGGDRRDRGPKFVRGYLMYDVLFMEYVVAHCLLDILDRPIAPRC
jgi:hypothetical protein